MQNFQRLGHTGRGAIKFEIDNVGVNELEKAILITEVKISPKKISLDTLKEKSTKLMQKFPNYNVEYRALSLNDI